MTANIITGQDDHHNTTADAVYKCCLSEQVCCHSNITHVTQQNHVNGILPYMHW